MGRKMPGRRRKLKKKQKIAKKLYLSASSLKDAEILKESKAVKHLPLQLLQILKQVSKGYPIKKTSLVHLFAILKHLAKGDLDLREKRALKQDLFKPFMQNWKKHKDDAINRFLTSTLLVRLLLDARELGGRVKAYILTTLPKGADKELRRLLGKPFFSKLLQKNKDAIQDLGTDKEKVQRKISNLFSALAEWMEKERLSQLKEFFSLFSVLKGRDSHEQREIRRDISFSFLVENFLRVVWKIKIPLKEQQYRKEIKALHGYKEMLQEASKVETSDLISAQTRDFSFLSSIMTQAASLRKRIEDRLKRYLPLVEGYLTLRERVELSSRQKMEKMRELLFGNIDEKALIGAMNEKAEKSFWGAQTLSNLKSIRRNAIQLQKKNEEEFQRGSALPLDVKDEIATLYASLRELLKARSKKALEEFEYFKNLSLLLNACFFNNTRKIQRYISFLSDVHTIFPSKAEPIQ